MKNEIVLKSTFAALFAAIICVGVFLRIPVGPVPIALQNMLCILTAVIAGGYIGFVPTAIFLLAGLIGLPVYSGGLVGPAAWMGPTGGFFPGYFLGSLLASLIAGKPAVQEKRTNPVTILRVSIAMIAGMVILYYPGVLHFTVWALSNGKVPEGKSAVEYTMAACVLPFIPGDVIKTVVGIFVAIAVRPIFARYVCSGGNKNAGHTLQIDEGK